MSAASDADLVNAARLGSDAAFGQLARRHSAALRSFLRGVCRDHALADDIAQDALIRGWQRLDQLRDPAAFRSWLIGTGWRLASEERRATGRRARREQEWSDTQDQMRPEGISLGENMALEAAMQDLTPDQRACISLCLAGGWSHGEAAEALDMPVGTIKSHIKRGRARLLAVLGGDS
ncbi:RNA polymerase sigma factor [Hyphobacterium sp. CCMP332]|jgi:RNA polymerase sigma-70 factor (ECF subfamily)|uniref:RNA polymerase sigma factor n=1 Tax=Hyphobacterium sp. CCMP332 TaxID=2749086 RepID=UPI00164FD21A|nr:RNA polymerase sigma factor [Hyphobacterium sp. CCMP332]QNL18511.1 RNA polymerase sigma factor [Hyphobacterium sp. CCMP332]